MTLKPGPSFKINKQVKRTMALGRFDNNEQRNAYKRSMIQAQLFEVATRPKGKGKKSEE
jgi:hypothetical protein